MAPMTASGRKSTFALRQWPTHDYFHATRLIGLSAGVQSTSYEREVPRPSLKYGGEVPGTMQGSGLRQYFPRGTDLSVHSQAHLNRVALRLNQRPRKTLGFETPADKLSAVLH